MSEFHIKVKNPSTGKSITKIVSADDRCDAQAVLLKQGWLLDETKVQASVEGLNGGDSTPSPKMPVQTYSPQAILTLVIVGLTIIVGIVAVIASNNNQAQPSNNVPPVVVHEVMPLNRTGESSSEDSGTLHFHVGTTYTVNDTCVAGITTDACLKGCEMIESKDLGALSKMVEIGEIQMLSKGTSVTCEGIDASFVKVRVRGEMDSLWVLPASLKD